MLFRVYKQFLRLYKFDQNNINNLYKSSPLIPTSQCQSTASQNAVPLPPPSSPFRRQSRHSNLGRPLQVPPHLSFHIYDFNLLYSDYSTATDLDKWSWSNQVGSYQWYIHGTGATTDYVNLSPSFGNPSDASSKQGAKLSISPTALWNSDMWRTELIPQTTSNLGTGKLWYHFSVKKTGANPPNAKSALHLSQKGPRKLI